LEAVNWQTDYGFGRKTLEHLQRRAVKIVYGFKHDIATETIHVLENLQEPWKSPGCALLVNKCLVGEVPLYFKDYFMLCCQIDNQHVFNRCTILSITDIELPKCHLGVTKKSIIVVHAHLIAFQHT